MISRHSNFVHVLAEAIESDPVFGFRASRVTYNCEGAGTRVFQYRTCQMLSSISKCFLAIQTLAALTRKL